MNDKVNVTIILPFVIDLRREPRIIANLEREAQQALRHLKISQGRAVLILPVIGNVVVKFNKIPAPNTPVEFNITFEYPYETERMDIGEEEKKMFYQVTVLPLGDWEEYWQRIYVDESIKDRALNYCLLMHTLRKYALSRMTFAQHRILVFYGPPGTGKTTLTRGLANKLARELAALGTSPTLYAEVKVHELSSQWLGEGPKLVEKTFGRVHEIAASGLPVICLIDEVESLLTNRAMTLNEANPVDVFRAVNAVFQQIDRLAERPNVYILATSNLPKAIDRAFFDRADMLFYVDLPNSMMRYRIFCDIFEELNRTVGTSIQVQDHLPEGQVKDTWTTLLKQTDGLSGRHLRKLVLEAMTYDAEIVKEPGKLHLEHIVQAISNYKERIARDQQHGGVYESL